MENVSVNKLIEEFAHLPLEDMEYVAEIIHKQLIDMKRTALAARAEEAKKNLRDGLTKMGSLKDIMEDLEGD
jgi:predicted DNA-binding protein